MNKKLALFLTPALLVSTTSMASDLQTSVGGKTWLNTWKFPNDEESNESNSIMMIGPSVTLKSGGFFAGASYMLSLSDYEFDYGNRKTRKTDRSDLDLVAGFMFTPRTGIYGGYKLIGGSGEYSDPDYGYSNSYDREWSGLGVGVTGNLPINDVIVLFGSFGIQSLEVESKWSNSDGDSGTSTTNLDGIIFEFGAGMALSPTMSISASYKQQNYEVDNSSDAEMNFGGLAASINIVL